MTNEEIARQFENLLEELKDSLKECNDGLLKKSEAREIKNNTINNVKKILPENSRQYRIFDKGTSEQFISRWQRQTLSQYVDKSDCKQFEQIITTLQQVLRSYEPEFLQGDQGRTEFYFSKGDIYAEKIREEFDYNRCLCRSRYRNP
jgi:predicted secreted protein